MMGKTEKLHQTYRDWLANLDHERLDAMASLDAWGFTLAIALFGLLIAGVVPITSDFFQLNLEIGFLCFACVCLAAASETLLGAKQRLSTERYFALRVVTAGVFQFFMWSLVCLTELPAAAVMASFPILLASYHGQAFWCLCRFLLEHFRRLERSSQRGDWRIPPLIKRF